MASIYTDVGENQTADFFDGAGSAPADWKVGWGTGAGTAAKGDTTLFTESGETRVSLTEAQPSSNINSLTATMTATAARTITNAGVFDAATAGNMVIKGDFTGQVLANGDKIDFTISLEWS